MTSIGRASGIVVGTLQELCPEHVSLLFEVQEVSIVENDVVTERNALFSRHLRCDPGSGVGVGEASLLDQTIDGYLDRTVHDDNGVEIQV
jgi:hypothetical protein